MGNTKKLGIALILVLALALTPAAWAAEADGTGSLGPMTWIESWIGALVESAFGGDPPANSLGADEPEQGNIIVPAG